MKKIMIISICIAAIAISAVIFILSYEVENNQESGTTVTVDNATKGKEINIFLKDGVGASDTP